MEYDIICTSCGAELEYSSVSISGDLVLIERCTCEEPEVLE